MTIAITGATGGIGGAVARHLAPSEDLLLLGRDRDRLDSMARTLGARAAIASYIDTAAMTEALRGAETVFLVSARESADRVAEHFSAVDAAVAAGIAHIVYLSFVDARADSTFTFARDHFATEQRIRDSGVPFTFVRDNFYQAIMPSMVGDDGAIRGPAGRGRVGLVSTADVSSAAKEVLRDVAAHDGGTYTLTGPESLTLDEIAAVLTEASGRDIRFEDETVEAAYASRAHYGAPAFEVDGWVSTYTAIAAGEFDIVTPDVESLTGRTATDFASFLRDTPSSWAHLV